MTDAARSRVLPFRRRRPTIRELTAHHPKPPAWAPGVTIDTQTIAEAIRRALHVDAPRGSTPAPDEKLSPKETP